MVNEPRQQLTDSELREHLRDIRSPHPTLGETMTGRLRSMGIRVTRDQVRMAIC